MVKWQADNGCHTKNKQKKPKQKQHDPMAVMFMNINLWAQDMKQPNKRSVPLLLDFPLGLLFVHWVLPDGCVCLLIHFLHLRKRCILEYSKTVTKLITSFITYVSACFTVRSYVNEILNLNVKQRICNF